MRGVEALCPSLGALRHSSSRPLAESPWLEASALRRRFLPWGVVGVGVAACILESRAMCIREAWRFVWCEWKCDALSAGGAGAPWVSSSECGLRVGPVVVLS